MSWKVLAGDCREVLRTLEAESVQTVVTSPPYWGLRDYGLEPQVWAEDDCDHEWGEESILVSPGGLDSIQLDGGTATTASAKFRASTGSFCRSCDGWRGSLGLEPTPDLYVEHLVQVFREVRRVLRKDGTLWLNLGDSYGRAGGDTRSGFNARYHGKDYRTDKQAAAAQDRPSRAFGKPKDMVGVPWLVAFALRADGWYLRSEIIWSKPNPMPESVTDRPTRAHEQLFLLTKSARYFYDADAVRESQNTAERSAFLNGDEPKGRYPKRYGMVGPQGALRGNRPERLLNPAGRNLRSVWNIPTEAHFATFPKKLVEPCVKAGTSEKGCCPECGAPWERIIKPSERYAAHLGRGFTDHESDREIGRMQNRGVNRQNAMLREGILGKEMVTLGWEHPAHPDLAPVPCIVLDPFAGSGTVGVVARGLGRRFVGIELSEEYVDMARRRISGTRRGLDEDGTPLWEQEPMFS